MKGASFRGSLMAGYRSKQFLRRDDLDRLRWESALSCARDALAERRARVDRTRESWPFPFLRGDCHCHSLHSDGVGTVAEIAQSSHAAGLDFQVVTDHWGVTQKEECRKHGLWWGQEPASGGHHLGILGLDHAFVPSGDTARDIAGAREAGATVFVAHPTGWYPSVVYPPERADILFKLPEPLLVEIINGGHRLSPGFGDRDRAAVSLWDRLLCAGRRVVAVANTDAHSPLGIGHVWNAVPAPRRTPISVYKALREGSGFVSHAPLLSLRCEGFGTGRKLPVAVERPEVSVRAADSAGLASVSLVADGRLWRRWLPEGRAEFSAKARIPRRVRRYVRLECVAFDGLCGFSNPLFLDAS